MCMRMHAYIHIYTHEHTYASTVSRSRRSPMQDFQHVRSPETGWDPGDLIVFWRIQEISHVGNPACEISWILQKTMRSPGSQPVSGDLDNRIPASEISWIWPVSLCAPHLRDLSRLTGIQEISWRRALGAFSDGWVQEISWRHAVLGRLGALRDGWVQEISWRRALLGRLGALRDGWGQEISWRRTVWDHQWRRSGGG